MTDWNEKNELNEQELEQAAGGVNFSDDKYHRAKGGSDGPAYVLYRCPKCGDTRKIQALGDISPTCNICNGRVKMVKA